MVGIKGNVWSFNEQLTTISWGATKGVPSDKVEDIRAALQRDVEEARLTGDDPYFSGKQMAAFARISLIADEIGETELAKRARDRVKPFIEKWMAGKNHNNLLYDQVDILGLSFQ